MFRRFCPQRHDVQDEEPSRHARREAIVPHFPSIVDIQCGEKAILL